MPFNILNCTISNAIITLEDGDACVVGSGGGNATIPLVHQLIITPDAGWFVDYPDFQVTGGVFSNGGGSQNIWSGGSMPVGIDNVEFTDGANVIYATFTLDNGFCMNDQNHVLDVCITGLAYQ